MRSHEARSTSVPPKLELWEDSQHCYAPVKTLDSPSLCPHDLRTENMLGFQAILRKIISHPALTEL